MVELIKQKIANEPALVVGAIVAGVVALAGNFNIVLDEVSVAAVVTPLVTAVVARYFVVPTTKVPGVNPGV